MNALRHSGEVAGRRNRDTLLLGFVGSAQRFCDAIQEGIQIKWFEEDKLDALSDEFLHCIVVGSHEDDWHRGKGATKAVYDSLFTIQFIFPKICSCGLLAA